VVFQKVEYDECFCLLVGSVQPGFARPVDVGHRRHPRSPELPQSWRWWHRRRILHSWLTYRIRRKEPDTEQQTLRYAAFQLETSLHYLVIYVYLLFMVWNPRNPSPLPQYAPPPHPGAQGPAAALRRPDWKGTPPPPVRWAAPSVRST